MIMPLSGPWAMVLSHQADLWSKTGARCVVIVCTAEYDSTCKYSC